jgi:hypothetical protein
MSTKYSLPVRFSNKDVMKSFPSTCVYTSSHLTLLCLITVPKPLLFHSSLFYILFAQIFFLFPFFLSIRFSFILHSCFISFSTCLYICLSLPSFVLHSSVLHFSFILLLVYSNLSTFLIPTLSSPLSDSVLLSSLLPTDSLSYFHPILPYTAASLLSTASRGLRYVDSSRNGLATRKRVLNDMG